MRDIQKVPESFIRPRAIPKPWLSSFSRLLFYFSCLQDHRKILLNHQLGTVSFMDQHQTRTSLLSRLEKSAWLLPGGCLSPPLCLLQAAPRRMPLASAMPTTRCVEILSAVCCCGICLLQCRKLFVLLSTVQSDPHKSAI